MANSNMLIVIFAIIILIAIIYYLNKNDDQPIPNQGTISTLNQGALPKLINREPVNSDNNNFNNNLVDELVAQYDVENPEMNISDSFNPVDPMMNNHESFNDYQKKQYDMKKIESPFENDEHDHRDFSYKKKKFTKRTPDDIKELFNIDEMLPKEIEKGWFDPVQNTKKINSANLIHPKVHMGINTVSGSLRNASHDIRGDIPNPKYEEFPWNNTTIERDTNNRGLCNYG